MSLIHWIQSSLARFYSTLIIVIVSLFLSIYAIHTSHQIKHLSESRLQDQIQLTNQIAADAFSDALWNFDFPNINTLLDSLLYSEIIIRAEVQGTNDPAPIIRGRPISASEINEGTVFKQITPIEFQKQKVGTLTIYFSREQSILDVQSRLKDTLILWFLMVASISGTTYFFTRQAIIHPILKLQQSAEQITAGNYNHPIQSLGKNEIGKLSHDLEKMRSSFLRFVEDLKHSHFRIQEANLQLEAKVTERTKELSSTNKILQEEVKERIRTEADLKIARDQADEANQIKSQFIANMSHELRTPLTSIIGFSELLLQEMQDPSHAGWREEVQIIRESGQHLLAIINDILDLSKIEAGRMDVQVSEFILQRVINEVAAMVNASFQQKENRLLLELTPNNTPLFSDERKIRQSLLNLISNANKFTDRGTVIVKMEFFQEFTHPWVRIQVQDSGIGMTPAQQEKLFQPFYQANSSSTRQQGGTGLGLAISKRFCEMIGGRVYCKSALTEGTTMTIEIPTSSRPES